MARRVAGVRAARANRSQAERRRSTRARLVSGVITAIQEHGVAGLRCRHVVSAFGRSWGAAQYQFAGKSALMLHVATEAVSLLSARLDANGRDDSQLHERIDRIVHTIWAVYSDAAYHALVEIVRGVRAEPQIHEQVVRLFLDFSAHIERYWVASLADAPVSRERSLACCNIVVLTLSGLASRRIYLRRESHTDAVLERLVNMMTDAFDGRRVDDSDE